MLGEYGSPERAHGQHALTDANALVSLELHRPVDADAVDERPVARAEVDEQYAPVGQGGDRGVMPRSLLVVQHDVAVLAASDHDLALDVECLRRVRPRLEGQPHPSRRPTRGELCGFELPTIAFHPSSPGGVATVTSAFPASIRCALADVKMVRSVASALRPRRAPG
jgi:hypothetical protein